MSDPTAPMDRPGRSGGSDAQRPTVGPDPLATGAGSEPPRPADDPGPTGTAEGPPVPPEGPAERASVPRVKTELRAGADRVKHAGERKAEEVKAEVERTKETLEQAKDDYAKAVEAKAGGTADDPEQAQQQVVDIRGGIERDLAALASRVPTGDDLKDRARTIGMRVGLPIVGVIGTMKLFQRRGASKRHQQDLQEQAEVFVRELRRVQADEAEERRRERERQLAAETGEGSRSWLRWVVILAGIGGAVAVARQRLQVEDDLPRLTELEEERDLPIDPGPPRTTAPLRPDDGPPVPPVPPAGVDPVTGDPAPPPPTDPGRPGGTGAP